MCLLAGSPVGANVTIHFCPFLTTHHSRQPIRFSKETFTSKILENADDSKMESNIVTHQKIAIKYCDAPSSKLIKSTSAGHIEKENHYTTLLSEKTKIWFVWDMAENETGSVEEMDVIFQMERNAF